MIRNDSITLNEQKKNCNVIKRITDYTDERVQIVTSVWYLKFLIEVEIVL